MSTSKGLTSFLVLTLFIFLFPVFCFAEDIASIDGKPIEMSPLSQETTTQRDKPLEKTLNSAEVYFEQGAAYLKGGKHNEAITYFNKVLEINPNHAKAYYNLGLAYISLGQYQQAFTSFQKALQIKLEKLWGQTLKKIEELWGQTLRKLEELWDQTPKSIRTVIFSAHKCA